MAEKYIMVSLEEEKAKDLANVISNKTSRKILDLLSDKGLSESDIAKELGVAASTINYNIKHLLKSGLIKVKDFYWSEKGNKVNVYEVSKKFIVIAPKGVSFKENLKKILPVGLVALVGAGLVQFFVKIREPVLAARDTFGGAEKMMAVDEAVSSGAGEVLQASTYQGYWFLIGAVFVLLVYLIIEYWRYKKNAKK